MWGFAFRSGESFHSDDVGARHPFANQFSASAGMSRAGRGLLLGRGIGDWGVGCVVRGWWFGVWGVGLGVGGLGSGVWGKRVERFGV